MFLCFFTCHFTYIRVYACEFVYTWIQCIVYVEFTFHWVHRTYRCILCIRHVHVYTGVYNLSELFLWSLHKSVGHVPCATHSGATTRARGEGRREKRLPGVVGCSEWGRHHSDRNPVVLVVQCVLLPLPFVCFFLFYISPSVWPRASCGVGSVS